jgi:23S rRNA pseudouridine1911/1915/1917 synthase
MVVVHKPAGMLAQPAESGDPTVADWLRTEIRRLHQANVPDTTASPFVAAVHRLDRPVSGVLVLARTSKSASRLSDQFQKGAVHKGYVAVVAPPPREDSVECSLWLSKNRSENRVFTSESPSQGSQQAHTRIQVLQRTGDLALVALFPSTGRPHQLRVTLAHLGSPILGDLRYGASLGLGEFIALHAAWIQLTHPTLRQPLRIFTPCPRGWFHHWPWLDSVASLTSDC